MSPVPTPERSLLVDDQSMVALRLSFERVGVAVLGPPALTSAQHDALLDEAIAQHSGAGWVLTGTRAAGEIEQVTERAHLGPVAKGFLAAPEVRDLLAGVTGKTLQPGWPATCYTYYRGPSQFLGEHCDKPDTCRIAMLVYLDVRWGASGEPGPGLSLTVYGGDNSSSAVAARVTARANRVTIINGSEQAHERPPLGAGESVVLLAGCFAVV